ncbi:hypothetical protein QTP88_002189 [Uroleucon formosanum]
MEKSGLTCAAHSLQLAVNKTLLDDEIQSVLTKSSKIVCHFKHSSISMKSLEKTQQQLNLLKLTLLQYCKTRWNSSFLMLERLYIYRALVTNVLADRNITTSNIAQKLEITESEWLIIEKLLVLLKSLQALTTLFCGELESYVSMVRPLMHKIVTSHYEHGIDDDNMTERFKNTISYQLTTRFELTWKDIVTARHVASFLDPRYKDMDHEPVKAREIIRSHVLQLIESVAPTIKNPSDTEESDLKMIWCNSPSSIKAPLQDLTFMKNLLHYASIDKYLSQIAVKKFCGHLWYLSAELCAFAFFDEAVPPETKRKMIHALNNNECSSELNSNAQRLFIFAKNANELLEKEIDDFICVNTKNLFKRFAINTTFLNEDYLMWANNSDYNTAVSILKNIAVKNDVAERGVKLIEDYNNKITKDESQKQYLLQVVSDYNKKYPDHRTETLTQVTQP